MRERRIDGDPLAELVPGCLWAELGEVHLGELRAPESFRNLVHIVIVLIYGAKIQKIFENNE